jgi:hypothetical protein
MSAKKKARPRETIEVVKNPDQVSQKIGYVVDEFKCCHNNFQGIMYAGPLAVVFLGRTTLRAVINRVNLGLEVNKKDEVLVDLIKYNRVDGISWLNQVPVKCPKVVPPVDCL